MSISNITAGRAGLEGESRPHGDERARASTQTQKLRQVLELQTSVTSHLVQYTIKLPSQKVYSFQHTKHHSTHLTPTHNHSQLQFLHPTLPELLYLLSSQCLTLSNTQHTVQPSWGFLA